MPVTRAEPLVSGKRGAGRGGDARCCRIPGTFLKVTNDVVLSFSGRRLGEERSCSSFFLTRGPAFALVCICRFSCLSLRLIIS